MNKDALNKAFNSAVKEAQQVDNTEGLDSVTANEVARRVFGSRPNSRYPCSAQRG